MNSRLKNAQGSSLIEMLVTVGILAIVIGVSATMFTNQQKALKGLSQKQEIIELKTALLTQLSKSSVCTWQMQGQTIDASSPSSESTPVPTEFAISKIYHGTDASSQPILIAGDRVPGTTTNLRVAGVKFKGIYATGNPNQFKGYFDIQFDESSTAMPTSSVRVQQLVRTVPTDPSNAKRIESCSAVNEDGPAQGPLFDSGWFQYNVVTAAVGPWNFSSAKDLTDFRGVTLMARKGDCIITLPTTIIANEETNNNVKWTTIIRPNRVFFQMMDGNSSAIQSINNEAWYDCPGAHPGPSAEFRIVVY